MEDVQKIRAKPVIEDEFWILSKNNIKIGQAKLINKDIEVRIHGMPVGKYSSVRDMKESGLFEFTELPKPAPKKSADVHGFPVEGDAYNAVWNVLYKLPLYTQEGESKSWYAAGYYKVHIGGTWVIQFCPKLITLQRNEYEGPFMKDPGLNEFDRFFECHQKN